MTDENTGGMARPRVDVYEAIIRLLKYILEGFVVAVAAYYIPSNGRRDLTEIFMLGIVASMTFSVLDFFAPSVGASVRTGAGFGIGANLVGFGGAGAPGGLMGTKL
jgi:hypothetical protein